MFIKLSLTISHIIILSSLEAETKLLPIETDKEWKIIETILEEIQSEANNEGNK